MGCNQTKQNYKQITYTIEPWVHPLINTIELVFLARQYDVNIASQVIKKIEICSNTDEIGIMKLLQTINDPTNQITRDQWYYNIKLDNIKIPEINNQLLIIKVHLNQYYYEFFQLRVKSLNGNIYRYEHLTI